MSRISFRVNSIELKDSALKSINQNDLIKLNLSQHPNQQAEEYILKNASYLHKIHHEFVIEDPLNKIEKLTLSLGKVTKKITLANFFNHDDNIPQKKRPEYVSIDKYIQGCTENRDASANCEYYETLHSFIGYRNIEIKELKKGVNNNFRIELLSRGTVKVIGYINLEIYIWDYPENSYIEHKISNGINEPILFVDPECPMNN